jgi:hypothetical protein
VPFALTWSVSLCFDGGVGFVGFGDGFETVAAALVALAEPPGFAAVSVQLSSSPACCEVGVYARDVAPAIGLPSRLQETVTVAGALLQPPLLHATAVPTSGEALKAGGAIDAGVVENWA